MGESGQSHFHVIYGTIGQPHHVFSSYGASSEMHYANTCIKVAMKYNYTISYTTWFKSERNVPNLRSSRELKVGSWRWKLLLRLLEECKWTQRRLPKHGSLLWIALIGDSSIPYWTWLLVLWPFISHFKHGYFKTINKLVNNCNMCICHEWAWWLGWLFGSGEVLSLEPLWRASLL